MSADQAELRKAAAAQAAAAARAAIAAAEAAAAQAAMQAAQAQAEAAQEAAARAAAARAAEGKPSEAGPAPALSLREQIEELIRSGKVKLPVLPETVLKVRELIGRDAEVGALVPVIGREPGLATSLLRYANSVAFAGLDEVTDLHHVVARLGMRATEQVVMAASVKDVFNSPDPTEAQMLRKLWSHASTVALASRRIADLTSAADPEPSFLAGLLHDIGKVVVLRAVSEMKRQDPKRRLSDESLITLLDSLHLSVGEELFEAWDLPQAIREVARHHHDADLCPLPPLVAVVALGDLCAVKMGESLKPDPGLDIAASFPAQALKLGASTLEEMMAAIKEDVERAKEAL